MTRARAALLFLTTCGLVLFAEASASSSPKAPVRRHGVVILFVIDHVSFEELLSVSEFAGMARAGGAVLMASSDRYRNDSEKVYEALGSGAAPDQGLRALLARTLASNGVGVCGRIGPGTPPSPKLFESESRSLLGGQPCSTDDDFLLIDQIPGAWEADANGIRGRQRRLLLEQIGDSLLREVRGFGRGRTLVLVASPTPSVHMMRTGDEVGPLVVAEGQPDDLLMGSGQMHALRSDTTRQVGLVSNVDVAPTILEFFGIPIPSQMDGEPIRVIDEPAPFRLHRLHLEQRRIRFPIQLAEVAFVSGAGLVAIVAMIMAARRRLPPRLAGGMRLMALCGAAFAIPLMLGGVLPRLTYSVVVPFLVLSVVALAVLAERTRWPGPLGPFTFLGVVGLSVVVVDAMLGWRGARVPLIGGTMFDGARYYGLPNAFLCLVLASALFVAAWLPPFTGFLILVGGGLFAGFPSLGADIGGAITLFFAAGLWWVLRTRRRFGLKELAFVAGVTALGLGAVLLANRYLPGTPTHATRFAERAGNNVSDALHEFGDRLSVGVGQVRKVPAALIPLLGLPVILALVLMRRGPIGRGLELAGERWQHVLVVLTLAGVVAFFVNDTGVAAAAPVFLYAMSGMAYPAFVAASTSSRVNSRPEADASEGAHE